MTAHANGSTVTLISALDKALRDWRGSGTLDDDVTVVVLEAEIDNDRV